MQDRNTMRLQLYMSRSGFASRRASESLILAGRVAVNGTIITKLGTKVNVNDVVSVDDKPLKLECKKRYVLLNKPAGYVCSSKDDRGRLEAYSLIKDLYEERLYNVGRLDMMSSGAIIFTNDGDFCAYLEHPSNKIEKEYEVTTLVPFNNEVLSAFMKGVVVEGIFYKAFRVARLNKYKMKIVLIEGKNREIRRVLQYFGIKIKSLVRLRIGSVQLANLGVGESRELSDKELANLTKRY